MGKLIKKILREFNELDWMKNIGQNKILTINKLKELFKKNNIDVDWDIEYDRSADGHGEYNEYFGKFYYDTTETMVYDGGRSYFIELYEKENGHLFFYIYKLDEEYDKYYRDEVYSYIETSSKNPKEFWRTVGWLVLYQMGKIKPGGGVETFNVENTIEESDDFDWVRDTPSNQKVKPWDGNIGYLTTNKTSPKYGKVYLYTDNEGVTREIKVDGLQAKHRTKNYKGEWFSSDGEVSFYDASVMDSEIQSKNYDPSYPDPYEDKYRITMSRQEYNDNALKGKLILTPNSNTVNESEGDFDWASDINWSKEMLDSMLSDCKTLRVANFNITGNKPYMSAGAPSLHFLSRCKEWWDYFSSLPLTDSGRGTAEWFNEDNYNDGEYGVIWNPSWGRKKITPQLEDLKNGYTSAITTQWDYGIEKQLNGTGVSEAWFVVDENNRPVYNLIPNNVKGYAKIYEEEFFGDKLNESKEDDFDWARKIPGTKEYNQKYRYFEIIACYGIDYETEECDDPYSHYVRIPLYIVDEIWDIPDVDFDYLAGPGDEGLGVIEYSINNNLIPRFEVLEIIMFEGVRELEEHVYEELTGYRENINESEDFDWVKDVPLTMNVCEAYGALKVGDEIIIDEIDNWEDNANRWDINEDEQTFYNVKAKVLALDKCSNIHRGNEHNGDTILVSIEEDGYYGFDDLWVSDFTGTLPSQCQRDNCMFLLCDKEEPYQIQLSEPHWKPYHDGDDVYWAVEDLISSINPERFKDVSDRGLGESKKTINEAAGISFEARKWGEIVYNEIIGNPNEKKRLIIDGYDHPEAFDGFPIDYVVIDFYDRLTGYGQEHSGYDKDGNYVVLLYIQPRLVQGQGGYDLRSVLNHEMKHAWEDYNRLSKGLPSIEQTKESQDLYNRDFILMLSDQNIMGPIKEILKYYYYLSDLEKSAYLENVYDQNKVYERVLRDIAGKDFNEFKDRFDLDINWHLMNTAYDIPFLKKFKSPIDFIDYSAEELRSKALKMIKKVNKMKYIHKK